jgi:hypothetical protein
VRMPRKSEFNTGRLNWVLQEQYSVITRTQAFACGMSPKALQLRIAPGGPWQRLLPGVYLAVTGTVTSDQRDMAALAYTGPGSLITGVAAVRRHHLQSPGPDVVDVLIPSSCRRQSVAFVRLCGGATQSLHRARTGRRTRVRALCGVRLAPRGSRRDRLIAHGIGRRRSTADAPAAVPAASRVSSAA